MKERSTLKRKIQKMPEFVKDSLIKNMVLEKYKQRPPYQRNDYLMWINNAKRDETKQKRLNQMITELKAGNKYMNMKWSLRI
jgi:uncharacterized protein YdeI (YjbR/CyaY-like superfamily)